jgi:hypothetical protein
MYHFDRKAPLKKKLPPTEDKTDITMYVNFTLSMSYLIFLLGKLLTKFI